MSASIVFEFTINFIKASQPPRRGGVLVSMVYIYYSFCKSGFNISLRELFLNPLLGDLGGFVVFYISIHILITPPRNGYHHNIVRLKGVSLFFNIASACADSMAGIIPSSRVISKAASNASSSLSRALWYDLF